MMDKMFTQTPQPYTCWDRQPVDDSRHRDSSKGTAIGAFLATAEFLIRDAEIWVDYRLTKPLRIWIKSL